MLKLKEIIRQLGEKDYNEIETEFARTKAEKYRYLFTSYRNSSASDDEISSALKLNASAYYTLKSRLFDKIRSKLSSVQNFEKAELMKVLASIPEMCVTTPRETANAKLQQLEQDLMKHGMHNELLTVYSALKKINAYTQKYFTYSQQYNRQVAYSIAVEKAEDVLCNFSKLLNEYFLSRNGVSAEALYFLKQELDNIYELNQSKKISLIRNLLSAQFYLFCENKTGENIEDMLDACLEIVVESPDPAAEKAYELAANALLFAYNVENGKLKQAEKYLAAIEKDFKLVYHINHLTCPGYFYEHYILYRIATGNKTELDKDFAAVITDSEDEFTLITYKYLLAMSQHYAANNKAAVQTLKKLVNDHSLLNLDKTEADVKLSLSWLLIQEKELEMADSIYRKVLRKLKAGDTEKFPQCTYLGKLFDFEINKDNSAKNLQRKKELFTLFTAGNTGKNKILTVAEASLRERFQI